MKLITKSSIDIGLEGREEHDAFIELESICSESLEDFIEATFLDFIKESNIFDAGLFIEVVAEKVLSLVRMVKNGYLDYYINETCDACYGAFNDKCYSCGYYQEITDELKSKLDSYREVFSSDNYKLCKILATLIIENINNQFYIDNSFNLLIKEIISDRRLHINNYLNIIDAINSENLGLRINNKIYVPLNQVELGSAIKASGDIIINIVIQVIDYEQC